MKKWKANTKFTPPTTTGSSCKGKARIIVADWHCFKDKVKMDEKDVLLVYLHMTQYVPGFKCPKCGVEFLSEETVMTIVAEAEDALDHK
jgi:peptide subunit release factor 1 (eRF1)